MPTGPNRKFEDNVWDTNKIYFKGETVFKNYSINRSISKYSPSDIAETLKEFEESKGEMSYSKVEFVYRLFITIVSGNTKARTYFKEFKTKFGGLSGESAEDYRDLTIMLSQ